jgi:hypothetical protein
MPDFKVFNGAIATRLLIVETFLARGKDIKKENLPLSESYSGL